MLKISIFYMLNVGIISLRIGWKTLNIFYKNEIQLYFY